MAYVRGYGVCDRVSGVNIAEEIELRALLEKLSSADLLRVAAIAIDRWRNIQPDAPASSHELLAAATKMREQIGLERRLDG